LKPIQTEAILIKAQTMADGGWRLTFDIPEYEASKVLQVYALKDEYLNLSIQPVQESPQQ
jgi:hypothetical protein